MQNQLSLLTIILYLWHIGQTVPRQFINHFKGKMTIIGTLARLPVLIIPVRIHQSNARQMRELFILFVKMIIQ